MAYPTQAGVPVGAVQQGRLQRLQLADGTVAGVADPQAEVDGDLVIAAARGVQTPRRLADQLIEARLHIHVDVLELVAEGEGPGDDLGFDRV